MSKQGAIDGGEKIGITTTVPVEVILAAGMVPVDLNNRFVNSPDRDRMVAEAEARGFPGSICAWIKGIYTARKDLGIERVVGVIRGDCANTEKLMEVWQDEGVAVVAFAYPVKPDPAIMKREIVSFAQRLGTTLKAAEQMRERLNPLRTRLNELDGLTFSRGKVTGLENHQWLVSSSDFNGDPDRFKSELESFLEEARARPESDDYIRLGYAGVPSIVDDLYGFLETRGARVVYNEVQRQFAMLEPKPDLARQYSSYTYPYDSFSRLTDINRQVERRSLRGIIHYAQTFCHRQIVNIIFRARLKVPVLTIEADKPGPLEARTKTRIEAFLEQIS